MADSDDPFLPSDLTHRPRPGGGRRAGAEPAFARQASSSSDPDPIPSAARALLGVGLNPLVQAASPLLLLIGQLRGTPASTDVAGLRRHALEEIRRFEEQAAASGVQAEIVRVARYVLCASLDEAVLSTPWGAQSEWSQHPLLVALHREAWGGEKFFEVLERISVDAARHIDLMELQDPCLAFGFTGKYQMADRGHERLADLQQKLYRQIRTLRGPAEQELSLRWRGLEDQRNRLIRYVPWWVVGAAGLAILGVTFALYYSRLATRAEPLQTALAKVGLEEFSAPAPAPAPPAPGPTLKQLLAPDEAAGTMSVEEDGGRTLVTLKGSDLFQSGSAAVNPAYENALHHIAAALNKVPGRVLITGHTDDQPIRSLRFRDNFELSRARAVGVTDVLKQTIDTPARLTSSGVGASEPRYRPESEPENRARNRRVEIVHLRGK